MGYVIVFLGGTIFGMAMVILWALAAANHRNDEE